MIDHTPLPAITVTQCPPGLAWGLEARGAGRECRMHLGAARRAWEAHQRTLAELTAPGEPNLGLEGL